MPAATVVCLSVCLSRSVLFLFLTFPKIPPPNSSKGKKARHSSNRSCALGVVAVCARKCFDTDYVGTSSTNTCAVYASRPTEGDKYTKTVTDSAPARERELHFLLTF